MTVKQPSPSDHIGQHVTLMDAHRAAKAGDGDLALRNQATDLALADAQVSGDLSHRAVGGGSVGRDGGGIEISCEGSYPSYRDGYRKYNQSFRIVNMVNGVPVCVRVSVLACAQQNAQPLSQGLIGG